MKSRDASHIYDLCYVLKERSLLGCTNHLCVLYCQSVFLHHVIDTFKLNVDVLNFGELAGKNYISNDEYATVFNFKFHIIFFCIITGLQLFYQMECMP